MCRLAPVRLLSVGLLVVPCVLLSLASARAEGPEASADGSGVRFRMAARREGPWDFPVRKAALADCRARFSADGTRLMTSTHDRVVVWEVPAMRPLADLRVAAAPIEAADMSPDGRRVLACDGAGTLRVWDVGTPEERWALRHEAGFAAASFSPDGRRVLFAREGVRSAVLADAATGEPVLEVTDDDSKVEQLGVAVFDPTGATFLTVGYAGRPKVWSAQTGRRVMTLWHGQSNRLVAFSPAGDRVAHDVTGWVRISDARTGKRLADTEPETRSDSQVANAIAIAFAPDGRTFATSVEDNARVWDAATGEARTPPLGEHGAASLSYSPDARRLATASRADDCSVWDVASGRRVCRIPSTAIYSLYPVAAFSPAGRHLAVNFGQVVELWEYEAGAPE